MSSDTSKRYALRGVSAGKEDVHNAIKNIDKGLFPQAFCKIVPDYLPRREYCLLCMQMEQELNLLWLICTGKKQVIYQYGRDCPGCINHEY
jgi:hypothetical protein